MYIRKALTLGIILLLICCTSDIVNKESNNRKHPQKEEQVKKNINPKNHTDFQKISMELFNNSEQYINEIFLCKETDQAFTFYNSFNKKGGRSRFSPKFINGKFYAMMRGTPLTIFELTLPAKDLPRMEKQVLNGYSFYFRLREIEFFLDDFEDITTCYDENDIEFESEYYSENMIYRKVKGSLLELFKP